MLKIYRCKMVENMKVSGLSKELKFGVGQHHVKLLFFTVRY
jgi:hypothetical protein